MAKKTKKTKKNGLHACLCGCGTEVKSIFRQGHDMKLRGMVMAHVRGEQKTRFTNVQLDFVSKANWMTPEIKKALPKGK